MESMNEDFEEDNQSLTENFFKDKKSTARPPIPEFIKIRDTVIRTKYILSFAPFDNRLVISTIYKQQILINFKNIENANFAFKQLCSSLNV